MDVAEELSNFTAARYNSDTQELDPVDSGKKVEESHGGGAALPQEVLDKILSFLPLPSLFQFRSVCQRWRSLPFSLLFLHIARPQSQPDSQDCWFFVFRLFARKINEYHRSTYKSKYYSYELEFERDLSGGSAYVRSANTTYEFLLPSPLVHQLHIGTLDVVATAGGLLLFYLRVQGLPPEENVRLFVYNPLTKHLRVLPPTQWEPQKLAIVVDGGSNGTSSFTVFSLGRHYRPGTDYRLFSFEAYNSTSGIWQVLSHVSANLCSCGELPRRALHAIGFSNSNTATCTNGFLYWMVPFDEVYGRPRRRYVCACDMHRGYSYDIPLPTQETTFARIAGNQDRLHLVCGLGQEGAGGSTITKSIHIWELDQPGDEAAPSRDYGNQAVPEGTRWNEVGRVSEELYGEFVKQGGDQRMECIVGEGNLIFIVAELEDRMLVHDPIQKSWQILPLSPILHTLFDRHHPNWYKVAPWVVPFIPKLQACV